MDTKTKLAEVHINYGHIHVEETTEDITEDQLKFSIFFLVTAPKILQGTGCLD